MEGNSGVVIAMIGALMTVLTGVGGFFAWVLKDYIRSTRDGAQQMAEAQIKTADANIKLAGAVEDLAAEVRVLKDVPALLSKVLEEVEWVADSVSASLASSGGDQTPARRAGRRRPAP